MKKSRYPKLTFENINTGSIKTRSSKVNTSLCTQPVSANDSVAKLLQSIPDILAGKDFKNFIKAARHTIATKNSFILMMGAHAIKCGLTPHLIRLLQKGIISHLALNGACAIHDIELAMWGKTSEEVGPALQDGSFGMCRETADFINLSLRDNKDNDLGYGECLAEQLSACTPPHADTSLIHNCLQQNVPFSIHSALGTEIIHQHPSLDGAAFGAKSLLDFQLFTRSLTSLTKESIVINLGSSVIMPEIFLKALTVVRNLGYPARGFTAAVFDMLRHYRPAENVQRRPTKPDGQGYYFLGHMEIMLPLVCALLNAD
ncbi:MAG TPA: hypothetical protein VKS21_11545 [Spirochaetota bacterium]|nr:hypothetical protein [Spirochaetota bacterium]